MRLEDIKKSPPQFKNKTQYATYCGSRPQHFVRHKTLEYAEDYVIANKKTCSYYHWRCYYKELPDHILSLSNQAIQEWHSLAVKNLERTSILVFASKDNDWLFQPDRSFAVTPIEGFPAILYPRMYYIPVRCKSSLDHLHGTTALSLEGLRRDIVPTFKWLKVEEVMQINAKQELGL